MYTAVGTTFIAKDTRRILLNLRSEEVSYPNTWSFWGGKIENTKDRNLSSGTFRHNIVESLGIGVKF